MSKNLDNTMAFNSELLRREKSLYDNKVGDYTDGNIEIYTQRVEQIISTTYKLWEESIFEKKENER